MSITIADTPARYTALLVDHLAQQGVDCTHALAMAGISQAQLRQPGAMLSSMQLTAVVRLLGEAAGRGDLGFEVGAMIGPGLFGDLGRALLSCATLRAAIDCSATYFELVTPGFSMRTRSMGERLEIIWQPVRAMPYDVMVVAFDIILVSFHKQVAQLIPGGLPPYDVFLSVSAPRHVARYRELKPARCHFGIEGLPALRIDIEAEVLEVPMPLVNASDLAEAERRLQPRLHAKPQLDGWCAWVAMMLHDAQDCQPTQAQIAQLVNVSVSTLARKLAEEGSSFRALAKQVRHERACQWLGEGVGVSEISRRLGYTDVANFSRAFRQQAGVSPSAFMDRA